MMTNLVTTVTDTEGDMEKVEIRSVEEVWPRAIGYIRVSTNDQSLSMGAQAARLDAYAQAKKLHFVDTCVDEDVSGSVYLNDRPGGSRLIERLNEGDAQVVVFPSVDRAFRSIADACMCVEEWVEKGVKVHFMDMDIDPSTPMGKVCITMMASFAEFERAMLSRRTKDALDQRRLNGEKYCKDAPYGWKFLGSSKENCKGTIHKHFQEQENIALICQLFASGMGPSTIAKTLTKTKVETRAGHCDWYCSTVSKILEREGLRSIARKGKRK